MPHKKYILAATLIMILLLCQLTSAKSPPIIPAQDYTVWGQVYLKDPQKTNATLLTRKDNGYVISLKIGNEVLTSYTMGSDTNFGDYYVLKLPMTLGDSQNKARVGDLFNIYINDLPASEAFLEPNHTPITFPYAITEIGLTLSITLILYVDQTPPYIANQQPEPNSSANRETSIYLEIKDDGKGVDQNSIQMKVKGDTVQPSITPIENGYSLIYKPSEKFLPNQVVDVTISASDLASPPNLISPPYTYRFEIKNEKPIASNLSISPVSPRTGDQLECVYTYTDGDGDKEDGTEIRWYKDDVYQSYYKNKRIVSSSSVKKGQVWYVTVKPRDGYEYGELVKSSSVIVVNSPPTANNVKITPTEPKTRDDLQCGYDYNDIDGDIEDGTEIRWYKDGVEQVGYFGQMTIPSTETSRGDRWQFKVRPKDGTEFGEEQVSSEVTIVNTPPVANNVVITPSNPAEGVKLICSYEYIDEDGDKESGTSIRWYKNETLQSSYNDSVEIPSGVIKKGETWKVVIRPKDGIAEGRYETSTVTVGNSPPVVEGLYIEIQATGDLIARYEYKDVNNDKEYGSEIRWYRNKILESGFNDQLVIPSSYTTKGDKWYFTVRPSDGIDYGEIKASSEVTIGNIPPMASELIIEPSIPYVGDSLRCSYEYTDADGDKESGSEIRWYRNGVEEIGYAGYIEIPKEAIKKYDRWYFTVRPKDGTDFGTLQTSSEVTIGNRLPEISGLMISPSSPRTGEQLECVYTYTDGDGDEEDGTEIKWYKDDVYQSYYKNKRIVSSSSVKKGQVWYVTVKPRDGYEYGELVKSSSVIVGNMPPIAESPRILPSEPLTEDDLICSYGYEDADKDAENGTEIKWYKNGQIQTKLDNSKTVPSSNTKKNEKWYFTVKPKDGIDFGELVTSAEIVIGNSPPIVSNVVITPSEPYDDDKLTCTYDYYDADGDKESGTTLRWYKNDSLQEKYNDQKVIPSGVLKKGDKWRVVVKPRDGTDYGKYLSSQIVEVLNTPPTVTDLIIQIASNGDLIAKYTYTDASKDPEEGTEIKWYKNGQYQAKFDNQKTIPADETSKGERWYFTVKPKDGSEFGKQRTSSEILIGNKPPVASKLAITPSNPLTTDDLICNYEYSDENGDSEKGTEIKWYKNGEEQTQFFGQLTVPSIATKKGEKWHFTVKPNDGTDFGVLKISPNVVIGNVPPIVKDIVITPANPKTGNSLECFYTYTDIDGDAEDGTEIKWYRDDIYQSNYKNKTVIPSSSVKKGQVWYVTIKPKDGTDFGELLKSSSVTVGNMPPIADELKIKPSNPKKGDDLVCEYSYTDTDDDPEKGTEIRWFKNDVIQEKLNDQKKVSSTLVSKGDKWYFTVRPKDGIDFGETKISAYVVIDNSLPIANKLAITPSNPLTTDDLVCKYEYSDENGDKEDGTEIRWYKNGVEQTQLIGQKIISSDKTKKGEKWYFTVKPKDGTDFGELKKSSEVIIGNTPPIVKDIVIVPSNPKRGDILECKYNYVDIDGDLEDGTEISWYKDNVYQSNCRDKTIVSSDFIKKGQIWYVTVKPKDGESFGEIVKSSSITIANTPPIANDLVLKPSSPKIDDDLMCEYSYTDLDDDPEAGTEIRWYKNGILQENLNNQKKVSSGLISKGDKWYFTVKPRDGENFGEMKTSSSVTVANTAPIADNLTIIPNNPKAGESLECKWLFIDEDGDKEDGSEIKWFKDSIEQKEFSGKTIIPSNVTNKGEKWHFTIKPKDGTDFGELKISLFVIIGNTPPIADLLLITTINPKAGDPLECKYEYYDADGDPEGETDLRWYKDGVEQTQYSGQKFIPSNITLKNEHWYFTVKPNDGKDFGELKKSSTILIGNTPPIADKIAIYPSNPLKSDALLCEYEYKDKDGDLENRTEIKWYKNGIEQEQYSGERSIPPNIISKGEKWYFTIRPKDGEDFGDLKMSPEVIVGNNPPFVNNVMITPSKPKANDALKCTYIYTDLDDDTESGTEIKWYKDDVYQSGYKNKTLIPSGSTKKGQTWYVTVQPKDGSDFGEIKSSPSVTITNSAPTASDLKIEPINPLTNDNLICSYSYNDIDDDPENGTEIRWYKNDVVQDAYNNQTKIPNTKTSKGERWHFTVRPKDGFDYGEFSISPSVVIGNTPPSVDNLVINPAEPTSDNDLKCSYQYSDIDNDAEGETQIRWFKDDQLQSKYNNVYTIPSIELAEGQIWYFTVQPNDGDQFGDIKRSNPVKIGKKPYIPIANLHLPVATDLKILPEEPYTNDDLIASYVYFDMDGDPESGSELKWYKNGIYQKDRDNYKIIPASEVSKGDRWYFTIRPKDGRDYGELKYSNEIIVKNSPPSVKNISITPSIPKKTDNLVCNYVYTDIDNDVELGTEIRWFKDGQLQPLYNDQRIIPPNELSKGQRWYFTIKPKDGTDFGNLEFSNEITIVNSVPIVLNVSISPKFPLTDDDILCGYEYSDADNDIEMGTEIKWFRDDQVLEKYNDQRRIPSSETAKGQRWYFTIRPRDGYSYGDIQKSEIITIGDSKPTITNLRITPSSPKKGDSLSCQYNYSDPDLDSENRTEIKWFKNGESQSEYDNKTTIPPSAVKKGDKWYFRIRTGYEKGFTNWQESLPVIVRNTPPVAVIKSDRQVVAVGSTVKFIGSDSYDIDSDVLSYRWDIDADDGISIDSSEREFAHIYHKEGNYTVTLIVNDGEADSIAETLIIRVENKIVLVGAVYNIPDEKLIFKFNKPIKSELPEIDGGKICMEIADSGKSDLQIQEKCQPIVNWSSNSDVIIDISKSPSVAFALVSENIIKHHKIDLILPADLIMDTYGIGNQAVLCSDDITIEMISDKFKIGTIGDVNGSGTITDYDAELMLYAVVNGIDTLPIYNSAMEVNRWLAKYEYSFNTIMDIADIDRDGLLSSYDASLIMQKTLKLIHENVSDNKQIYRRAVLKVDRHQHQDIDMSVILNNVSKVYSVDLVISYNPQELMIKSVSKSKETSKWLLAYAISESGKLKISMAGTSQPDNGNTIVNIRFGSLIGSMDMPKIESIQLNGQKFGTIIENIPKQTLLLQNYPNPCKDGTWIPYQISSESEVSIEIYDQLGKLVKKVFSGQKSPGNYTDKERSAYWDCRNEFGEKVSSGIYFYKLQAGNVVLMKKMIVLSQNNSQ